MKVQIPSRRTLPGRRPEVLLLDPTVGVDWFRFGEGWCGGRAIRPDEVEMRIYPMSCVPDSIFGIDDCEETYGPSCRWCYPDPTPVNLIKPDWRGGWPPRRRTGDENASPYVSCPALEVKPNGDVSFQYDSAVYDFVSAYYKAPLVGVFFLNDIPSGTVRFETDHRPVVEHLKREENIIPTDQEACGGVDQSNKPGQLPGGTPTTTSAPDPACPGPYDPEYDNGEYPYYTNIEYPCNAEDT